jgi:hypothetical protein
VADRIVADGSSPRGNLRWGFRTSSAAMSALKPGAMRPTRSPRTSPAADVMDSTSGRGSGSKPAMASRWIAILASSSRSGSA